MSIADAWSNEKGSGERSVDLKWTGDGTTNRIIELPTADRISKRVLEATADDGVDFGDAMMKLAGGVQRKVTFRSRVTVSLWVERKGTRRTFDDLPKTVVEAGKRGTTKATMVDGSDLVLLYDGREVLARVGEDCKILSRWHRLVDWFCSVDERHGGRGFV